MEIKKKLFSSRSFVKLHINKIASTLHWIQIFQNVKKTSLNVN